MAADENAFRRQLVNQRQALLPEIGDIDDLHTLIVQQVVQSAKGFRHALGPANAILV